MAPSVGPPVGPPVETVFDALGDATRRRILAVLAGGEQPAGAVVEAVQAQVTISQPAVSQHLKVLRDAGLVTVRAEGTRRYYAVDVATLETGQRWLAHLADPTAALARPLDALATEVARGRRDRRRSATPSTRADRSA